jgi:tetratricopeptide (TPR) repeat protein
MNQLNRLTYEHSAYAAFETAFKVLSPAAQQSLSILSFYDPSSFPRSIIEEGAKSGFTYEHEPIADRSVSFDAAVALLVETFGKGEADAEIARDEIFEELQAYSLVTLTLWSREPTMQMHQLTHAWARDRLGDQERSKLRLAAVRLIASANNPNGQLLQNHLVSHVETFFTDGGPLPLNDRASFAIILQYFGRYSTSEHLQLWHEIYTEVVVMYGDTDIRICAAKLSLADARFRDGDTYQAIELERSVVHQRQTMLGKDAPETIYAMGNLARSLRDVNMLDEAENMEKTILRYRMSAWGLRHSDTAQAQEDLALTYQRRGKHSEAISLLLQVLKTRKILLGSYHNRISETMALLGLSYEAKGQKKLAEETREETLRLRARGEGSRDELGQLDAIGWLAYQHFQQKSYSSCQALGQQELDGRRKLQGLIHPDTLCALFWLARVYFEQAKYADAQTLWEEELEGRRQCHESPRSDTLTAMYWLARTHFEQANYEEAQTLWEEELEGLRQLHGSLHSDTLAAMFWLARGYFEQGKYQEAQTLWEKALEGHRQLQSDTSSALYWIGRIHYQEFNYSRARTMWEEALERQLQLQGPLIPEIMHWLGRVYSEEGHHSKAVELFKQSLDCNRSAFGPVHQSPLAAIGWLAQAHMHAGHYLEAVALWEEQLKGMSKAMGSEYPNTLRVAKSLEEARSKLQ